MNSSMDKVGVFEDNYISSGRTPAKPIKYTVTNGGCWECYSHSKQSNGYPVASRNGKNWKLSRWVYTLTKGVIKKGNVILHSCDNPLCINPDHLSQGTMKENTQDMISKGRDSMVGSKNKMALLNETDVYEIKHLLRYTKMSHREIGLLYGVNYRTITNINIGARWVHVTI